MSTHSRPTPETDAEVVRFARIMIEFSEPGPNWRVPQTTELVPADHARRLEQQRDELAGVVQAMFDYEISGAPGYLGWDVKFDELKDTLARIREAKP